MTGFRARGPFARLVDVLWLIGVVLIVVFAVGPFLWIVISSLSPSFELMTRPVHWFPAKPTLDHFRALLSPSVDQSSASTFIAALRNSFLVSIGATAISVAIGAIGAYPISRLRFAGRRGLFYVILFAQLLPPIALLVPLYVLLNRLGFVNTIPGLIAVYISFSLPFAIWVMRGYYDGIPADLEAAALIDGCSRLQALWHIILPLAAPGMAATAIFSFLQNWNEFFFAVVFTSSPASKTIPVVVAEFSGRFTVNYGLMTAAGVLGSLVPIVLALVFQRGIVSGLTAGSVKG